MPAKKITDAEIREKAYLMWKEDGARHGSDQDYWFRAEQALKSEAAGATPGKPAAKKAAARKPAAKKPAAKKPAAKAAAAKPASGKKPAARKTAAKKPSAKPG